MHSMCTSMPWCTPFVLQRADHLEARCGRRRGPAADSVCPPKLRCRIRPSFVRSNTAPHSFELAHPLRRLLGVELGHAPLVEELAAAHRVAEMHLPAVAVLDIGQRRRHAAFGHHRVRLAQQRLADQADFDARRQPRDRRAEPSPAGADDDDVVLMGLDGRHARVYAFGQNVMAGLLMSPRPSARTYMSAATTEMRLAHAHTEWRTLRMVTFSHIVCRVRACRVHEKQSKPPRDMYRNQ